MVDMAEPDDSGELLTLRRKPRFTGWFQIAWRFLAVAGLIGILVLFHWRSVFGAISNSLTRSTSAQPTILPSALSMTVASSLPLL